MAVCHTQRLRVYSQSFERHKHDREAQSLQLQDMKHDSHATNRDIEDEVGSPPRLPTHVTIAGDSVDIADLPFAYLPPAPVGVVLVPTRELAQQIAEEAKNLLELHPNYEVAIFVGSIHKYMHAFNQTMSQNHVI